MAIKSKKTKVSTRQRTKYRIRKKIIGTQERARVTIYRSGQHIHCQAIEDFSGKTIASASTLEKEVLGRVDAICSQASKSTEGEATGFKFTNESKSPKSMRAAFAVGYVLAERLKALNQSGIVFDRNGFIYHGRVKAFADGARSGGLQF